MWTGVHRLAVAALLLCFICICRGQLKTCSGLLCPMIPSNVQDNCIQGEKFVVRNNEVCMECARVKQCDFSRNATEYIPLCPKECPSLPAVRDSCIRRGPVQWIVYRGQTIRCRECPQANPFCLDSDLPLCPEEAVDCIGVIQKTPIDCINQKIKGIQIPCLTCQRLKSRPECQRYDYSHLPLCRECPRLPNVPARCIILGRVLTALNGQCRECPSPNLNCKGLKLELCDPASCTPIPANTEKSCIVQTISQKGTTPCLTCPLLRRECQQRNRLIPRCTDSRECVMPPIDFPAECVREGLIQTLSNGMVCRGCPYLNPRCAGYPMQVCPQIAADCLPLPSYASPNCIEQDVLDLGLGLCLSCPRLKADPGCTLPLCPGEICPSLAGIPDSCIKPGQIVQSELGECSRCPTVDPLCTSDPGIKLCPDTTCPPLTGIPSECLKKATEKQLADGSICSLCPEIDPFCQLISLPICSNHILDCVGVADGTDITCIDQKVIFVNEHCLTCPALKQEPRCLPPVDIGGLRPCPINRCKEYPPSLVPKSCYTLGPSLLLSNGLECRGCPSIDPFCRDLKLQLCASQAETCTVLPADIPLECKTADLIEEAGVPCLSCPKVKDIPACVELLTKPRIDTPPPSPPDKPVPAVLGTCDGVICIPTVGIEEKCLSKAQVIGRSDGTRCLGCRKINASCVDPPLNICPSQYGTCTPIPEERRKDKDCISQQVLYENNAHCLTCEFVIPDCYVSSPPPSACTGLVCDPLPLDTPQECITQEALTYNGEECFCPARIPGCGENPLSNNPFLQT